MMDILYWLKFGGAKVYYGKLAIVFLLIRTDVHTHCTTLQGEGKSVLACRVIRLWNVDYLLTRKGRYAGNGTDFGCDWHGQQTL
jgi:hypothetical protein